VIWRARSPYAGLVSITAPARRDAWALGWYQRPRSAGHGFLMHWNGARWARVTLALLSSDFFPFAIVSTAPDNVWITGETNSGLLTEDIRFDGVRWQLVPAPPRSDSLLQTAFVQDRTDAWGWQQACGGSSQPCFTDLQRWNGTSLSDFRVPVVVQNMTGAGGTAWFAGLAKASHEGRVGEPVIYRWTGSRWRPLGSPWRITAQDLSVTAAPNGDLWLLYRYAVPGRHWRAALRMWSHGRWSRIPIPATVAGGRLVLGGPIVYDGHDGFWSLYAHWTGSRWINALDFARTGLSRWLYVEMLSEHAPVAPVPGTSSAWALACEPPDGNVNTPCLSAIVVNGRLP
jgi:hypothetical protein